MRRFYFLLFCFFVVTGYVIGQTGLSLKIDSVKAVPSSICRGESSQLNVFVSGGTGSYTYLWSPGKSLNDSTISNPIANPTVTTLYNVIVKEGLSSDTDTISIFVNPLPNAYINGGDSTCHNGSVVPIVFTAIFGTAPYTFFYNFNGENYQQVSDDVVFVLNHEPIDIGRFQYILVGVSDRNGCYNDATGTETVMVYPNGQVNSTSDLHVCNNEETEPISFSSNNTAGFTTYTWTNDKPQIGLPASGYNEINAFTANNPGFAPLYATISVTPYFHYDSDSCAGPSEEFSIIVNPSGQVNQPDNRIACNGETVEAVYFSSENTGGTVIFEWTNDKPEIGLQGNGIGSISPFTAVNSGDSPVIATVEVTPKFDFHTATPCSGPSKTFTITVNPSPTANFTANGVCDGSPMIFTDLSAGEIDEWLWDFGDGQHSTEENPIHTYSSYGEKTVKLIVRNSLQDCPGMAEMKVMVYSIPKAGFTFENSCGNSPVDFQNTSANDLGNDEINFWKWDFGDGGSATTMHATHTYAHDGEYNVKLLVKASEPGCADSITKNLKVFPLPSFSILGASNVCRNLKDIVYQISNLENAVPENSEISWNITGGSTTGEPADSVRINWLTTSGSGSVECMITNKSTGCVSPLVVFPVTFSPTFSAPEPETVVVKTLDGDPVLFIYPESGYAYTWYKNNEPIPDANLQYYYPGVAFDPADYKVYLEPIGDFGETLCGNFAYPEASAYQQKIYTFREDDLFLIYPNPACDAIGVVIHEKVAGADYNNIMLSIVNPAGIPVLEQQITSRETNIGVSHLPEGIYFVEIIVAGNIQQVRKLLIQ
ncbi:MAG: PKD domain-containing protein [Bacteroidota bacterium]